MNGRPRKGRPLSPEERALWEQVAATAHPLHPKRKRRTSAVVEPEAEPAETALKAEKIRQSPGATATATAIHAPKPKAAPAIPALAPLERRQRQKLSRGTGSVDARIDLHGLTQAEAHTRLAGFLRMAQAQGHQLVLVITGKGGPEGSLTREGRGILRRVVPQWLALPEFRAFVVGFEEAHRGHGGTGALYVRIRKKKGRETP